MHIGHGAYIGIILGLVVLLLLVFQLKRRMDEISDQSEMLAEDHLLHPEDPPEPTILPHVHHDDQEVAPAPLAITPEPLGPPDDLTRLKGLGPRAQARLNELGITRYDQMAAWSDDDVRDYDRQMGSFAGRIARDRWAEQARLLASGDTAAFELAFGKLG